MAYFSLRWSIQRLSIPCHWNSCFVQTSLSVLKPHSWGEVGTEGSCFQMATCLHAPDVQHLTWPKGREVKEGPSLVLTEVKEHFVLMPFKYSEFSGSRNCTMEQNCESKTSNELNEGKMKILAERLFLTSNFSAQVSCSKVRSLYQKAVLYTEIINTSSLAIKSLLRQGTGST